MQPLSGVTVARESSPMIPTEPEHPIDLAEALQLAGIDNPTIELAVERVRESLADQLAARTLLAPSINVGSSLRLHRGVLQDDPGFLREPNSQSLEVGAGVGAIGAGAVALPGVWMFANLGDVVFEPRVARQRVAVRRFDAQATQHNILLDVAAAYLELVRAELRVQVFRQAEADVSRIVRVTADFAKTGQGAPSDASRARTNLELVRRDIRETEGGLAAARARLAQLLNLDPSAPLRTPGGDVQMIRLVPENSEPEFLVNLAVQARPELAARAAAIQEARTQERQQRVRPWLPLIAVGYSAGGFGGGSDEVADEFGPLKDRSDLDVIAAWNLQNMGVGNHLRVRRAQAVVGQALASYGASLNQIRREVAEAQAGCKTAAQQVVVAEAALVAAQEGFRLETDRIRLGQAHPIEAIDNFRQLLESRDELLRSIIAYDIAQFRLFVAIGNNPAVTGQACN